MVTHDEIQNAIIHAGKKLRHLEAKRDAITTEVKRLHSIDFGMRKSTKNRQVAMVNIQEPNGGTDEVRTVPVTVEVYDVPPKDPLMPDQTLDPEEQKKIYNDCLKKLSKLGVKF